MPSLLFHFYLLPISETFRLPHIVNSVIKLMKAYAPTGVSVFSREPTALGARHRLAPNEGQKENKTAIEELEIRKVDGKQNFKGGENI